MHVDVLKICNLQSSFCNQKNAPGTGLLRLSHRHKRYCQGQHLGSLFFQLFFQCSPRQKPRHPRSSALVLRKPGGRRLWNRPPGL